MTRRLATTPLLPLAITALLSAPAVALADEPSAPAATYSMQPSRTAGSWTESPAADPYDYRVKSPQIDLDHAHMRRNKPLAAAGGVTMGVGLLTTLAGIVVGARNLDCHREIIFPVCHASSEGVARAADGMMIGGAITLVVGIPILVMGLKKRHIPDNMASYVGEPTANGWRWKF